jgi:predicted nucleotidyltransferase
VNALVAPTREGLFRVLAVAAHSFERANVPYVVGGGLAAEAYGLRETINDVDLFVRPVDAPRAGEALERDGFYLWVEDPRWLYKAIIEGVTVDVIYESTGLVHVSDETFQRARLVPIDHTRVPIMPPEDLFVMKAAAATPAAPKHWLDAISLLANQAMDWDYLAQISARNPHKIFNALVHASQDGVPVPSAVFVRLSESLSM